MAVAPKKKDGRGGARPNSGPKKQTLSVRQVREMQKRAKEYASKYGVTLDEILLDFCYGVERVPMPAANNPKKSEMMPTDKPIPVKDRMAAVKLYKEYASIKPGEGGEADKKVGPNIYLPEHRPVDNVTPINKDDTTEEG